MKRRILASLALAACACACGGAGGARTRVDVLGDVLARLEVTHARTVEACARGERPCAAASFPATAAVGRMRSDLAALWLPRELADAKREWLGSLDVYAQASGSLATASCAGGQLGACVLTVNEAMEQARRSLAGGAVAVGGGIAMR